MRRRFSYSIVDLTRRLLKIAAPVKGTLAVSTLASILGNLAQMGLMGFGALFLMACAEMTDGSPWIFGGLMVFSAFLIVACRYVEGVVSHAGAYELLAGMRIRLYQILRLLAPACLMDQNKGDILNIAVSDIETIEYFFAHAIGPMFTVIILPCVTLVLAFWFNPLFAAVLLPIYAVVSLAFPLIAIRAGRRVGLRFRSRLGELKALVLESVYGLKDIQIFGFGPRRLAMVQEKNRAINRSAHGLVLHQQTVSSAPTFFVYLARILVIGAASYLAASGAPNPQGTVILSFVAAASFSSTQSLTSVVSNLLETYAAAERLFRIEDTRPEVTEPAAPKSCGPIRSIVFDHVQFSYPGTGEAGGSDAGTIAASGGAAGDGTIAASAGAAGDGTIAASAGAAPAGGSGGSARQSGLILRDFCLTISGNEKLGIAGESGIGKSTVLRLLLRFWNPTAGQIRINGIPIEEISLSELRSRIAVLEQDTFLFNGSIGENIAIGKPEASKEEIETAARRAGLHDFIATLPDGYDTQMGQMGARLSGGERQRVGIARTMLTDPDVIVMDEPTSSLDVLHEKELLKTLSEECSHKMLIIISHRPSTLTGCSRVVRLKGGKMEECC